MIGRSHKIFSEFTSEIGIKTFNNHFEYLNKLTKSLTALQKYFIQIILNWTPLIDKSYNYIYSLELLHKTRNANMMTARW